MEMPSFILCVGPDPRIWRQSTGVSATREFTLAPAVELVPTLFGKRCLYSELRGLIFFVIF